VILDIVYSSDTLADSVFVLVPMPGYYVVRDEAVKTVDTVLARDVSLMSVLYCDGDRSFELPAERWGFFDTTYFWCERRVYTYINFEDLDFDGPAFGFRNIPDQYSLNYAYEKYLKNVKEPKFLFFLTVSSHSPWLDLPPYEKDWRHIKSASQQGLKEKNANISGKVRGTMRSKFSSGIGFTEYLDHMMYELKIIRDFILHEIHPNSIVIILGDHQPPIITEENPSFATPLHFISGDQELLQSLQEYGFSSGLQLDPSLQIGMQHEGLYSLLIRVLAQNYSSSQSIPDYFPLGKSFSNIQD